MSNNSKIKVNKTKSSSIFVIFVFLLSDLGGMYLSFSLASTIRQAIIPWVGGMVSWPVYQPIVILGIFFTLVLFSFANLYPGYGLTAVKELELLVKVLSLVFGLLAVFVYFLRVDVDFPRSIFLIAWANSILLIPLLRFLIRNRLSLTSWYGIPLLLLTDNIRRIPALEAIQNCRRMGWNVVGIHSFEDVSELRQLNGIPLLPSWDDVVNAQKDMSIKTVLVSSSFPMEENDSQHSFQMHSLKQLFRRVIIVLPVVNFGSVWVKPRDIEGQLGLEITHQILVPTAILIKYVFDFTVGLFLIIVLSPLLLLISFLIRAGSPGPVFFKQKRLGLNQHIFKAIKFRTMVIDADEKLQEMLKSDPQARQEYLEHHKITKDPRMTRIGKWLRKYSLDELPQLFNVIQGDMSIIGPRAYMPEEREAIGDYIDLILQVKPGMTGWWQVMGRHQTTFQTRLVMDEYYLSNWSLWLDAFILMKTGWVVISGTGE